MKTTARHIAGVLCILALGGCKPLSGFLTEGASEDEKEEKQQRDRVLSEPALPLQQLDGPEKGGLYKVNSGPEKACRLTAREDHFDEEFLERDLNYTFDEEDQQVRLEIDREEKEGINKRVVYTYNDDGRVTKIEIDEDADGQFETTRPYEYEDGRVVGYKQLFRGPDTVSRHHHLEYDDQGKLTRKETDYGLDGEIDGSIEYVYDDEGRLVRKKKDTDADGEINKVVRQEYEDDRVVRITFDGGISDPLDGNPSRAIQYEYDRDGNRIREQHYSREKGDLEPGDVKKFTYDEYAYRTRLKWWTSSYTEQNDPYQVTEYEYECNPDFADSPLPTGRDMIVVE